MVVTIANGCTQDPAILAMDFDEWRPFEFYTPLVWSFELDLSGWDTPVAHIFQALRTLRSTPVFPNLQELKIIMANPPFPATFLPCLFSPSIRTVRLKVTRSNSGDQNHDAIAEIIRAIHLLQLEELELSIFDTSVLSCSIIARAVSDAITGQPLLLRLKVLDLQDRFLLPWLAASRLLHLTHATFHESDAFDDPWYAIAQTNEVSPVSGFPALRHAALGVAINGLVSVLTAIASAEVLELKLLVQAPEDDDTEDASLNGRLETIKGFLNLTTLHISFAGTRAHEEDLHPLLACHALQILILRGKGLSASVDDGGLEAMALSWPVLESLEITDSDPHPNALGSPSPRVTLRGLGRATKHFHILRRLSLGVDASRPDLCSPDDIGISESMVDVRLPLSRAGNASNSHVDVAKLIVKMWPRQRVPSTRDLVHWLFTRHHVTTFDVPVVVTEGDPWLYIWAVVFATLSPLPII